MECTYAVETYESNPPAATIRLANDVIAYARAENDDGILAKMLSAHAQLLRSVALTPSNENHGGTVDLLTAAQRALAEAASLRTGPDRGRTMATLAQTVALSKELGVETPAQVNDLARSALRLVDPLQNPLQWFAIEVSTCPARSWRKRSLCP